MNHQSFKSFGPVIIILIILVVAAAVIGRLMAKDFYFNNTPPKTVSSAEPAENAPGPEPAETSDDLKTIFLPQKREIFDGPTATTKTYKDYEYNFELTYPRHWQYAKLTHNEISGQLNIHFGPNTYDYAYTIEIAENQNLPPVNAAPHPEVKFTADTSRPIAASLKDWPIYYWLDGLKEFKYPPATNVAFYPPTHPDASIKFLTDCLGSRPIRSIMVWETAAGQKIYHPSNSASPEDLLAAISERCPNNKPQLTKTNILTPNPVYRLGLLHAQPELVFYIFQSADNYYRLFLTPADNEAILKTIAQTVKTAGSPAGMTNPNTWETYVDEERRFSIKYPGSLNDNGQGINFWYQSPADQRNWLLAFGPIHETPLALSLAEYPLDVKPRPLNRWEYQFTKTITLGNNQYVFTGYNLWGDLISQQDYQIIFDNFVNSFTKF